MASSSLSSVMRSLPMNWGLAVWFCLFGEFESEADGLGASKKCSPPGRGIAQPMVTTAPAESVPNAAMPAQRFHITNERCDLLNLCIARHLVGANSGMASPSLRGSEAP